MQDPSFKDFDLREWLVTVHFYYNHKALLFVWVNYEHPVFKEEGV